MMHNFKLTAIALMLIALAYWLAGCASNSPPSGRVPPATIPPLPPQARQPAIPSECLPTCLSALTRERESWLNTLTAPESPAKPASAAMTR